MAIHGKETEGVDLKLKNFGERLDALEGKVRLAEVRTGRIRSFAMIDSAEAGTNYLPVPFDTLPGQKGGVPEGYEVELESIAAYNSTSAMTYAWVAVCTNWGAGGAASEGFQVGFLCNEIDIPANRVLYYPHKVTLGEGEFIKGNFAGCTQGDVILMWVKGFWRELR